jgi:hypothetical protein
MLLSLNRIRMVDGFSKTRYKSAGIQVAMTCRKIQTVSEKKTEEDR